MRLSCWRETSRNGGGPKESSSSLVKRHETSSMKHFKVHTCQFCSGTMVRRIFGVPGHLSLHEDIVKFRHLQKYLAHVYQIKIERARKFIRGLKDGSKSKVMSRRPQDLDDAIDLATWFEKTETKYILPRKYMMRSM